MFPEFLFVQDFLEILVDLVLPLALMVLVVQLQQSLVHLSIQATRILLEDLVLQACLAGLVDLSNPMVLAIPFHPCCPSGQALQVHLGLLGSLSHP